MPPRGALPDMFWAFSQCGGSKEKPQNGAAGGGATVCRDRTCLEASALERGHGNAAVVVKNAAKHYEMPTEMTIDTVTDLHDWHYCEPHKLSKQQRIRGP